MLPGDQRSGRYLRLGVSLWVDVNLLVIHRRDDRPNLRGFDDTTRVCPSVHFGCGEDDASGLGLRHQRSKEEGEEYWGEALTWKLDRDQLKQGGYRRRGERVLVTVLCSSHRRHLHPRIQLDLITWFLP